MSATRIGSFEINRIADYQGPFFDPPEFFPDFDPAVVEEHAALLGPRLLELSAHPVEHLAGFGQRRQDFCLRDRQREIRIPAVFFEQLARPIERRVAAVNQRQHGIEYWAGGAGTVRRG